MYLLIQYDLNVHPGGAIQFLPYIPSANPTIGDSADGYLLDLLAAWTPVIQDWLFEQWQVNYVGFYWQTSLGIQRWEYPVFAISPIWGAQPGSYGILGREGCCTKQTASQSRARGRLYCPGAPYEAEGPGGYWTDAAYARLKAINHQLIQPITSQGVTFTPASFRPMLDVMEPIQITHALNRVSLFQRRNGHRDKRYSGGFNLTPTWSY